MPARARKNSKTTLPLTWQSIYRVVARIPRGRVATYGTVARLTQLPGRARLVGTALKNLPSRAKVPWHRVLGAGGRLAFPEGSDAFRRQCARLRREGVHMVRNRISMERYGWPQDAGSLDERLWRFP
jgi:methylated-DNA-protein-cysteine methyltransferase-like protein